VGVLRVGAVPPSIGAMPRSRSPVRLAGIDGAASPVGIAAAGGATAAPSPSAGPSGRFANCDEGRPTFAGGGATFCGAEVATGGLAGGGAVVAAVVGANPPVGAGT
ncbi:MAG: hypothetical protein ACK55Z_29415, partial [bacterium]